MLVRLAFLLEGVVPVAALLGERLHDVLRDDQADDAVLDEAAYQLADIGTATGGRISLCGRIAAGLETFTRGLGPEVCVGGDVVAAAGVSGAGGSRRLPHSALTSSTGSRSVVAVVYVMRGAFKRHHLLAEARRRLSYVLRGRPHQGGLDERGRPHQAGLDEQIVQRVIDDCTRPVGRGRMMTADLYALCPRATRKTALQPVPRQQPAPSSVPASLSTR